VVLRLIVDVEPLPSECMSFKTVWQTTASSSI